MRGFHRLQELVAEREPDLSLCSDKFAQELKV
jgi:hypothetical protein